MTSRIQYATLYLVFIASAYVLKWVWYSCPHSALGQIHASVMDHHTSAYAVPPSFQFQPSCPVYVGPALHSGICVPSLSPLVFCWQNWAVQHWVSPVFVLIPKTVLFPWEKDHLMNLYHLLFNLPGKVSSEWQVLDKNDQSFQPETRPMIFLAIYWCGRGSWLLTLGLWLIS